MGNHGSWIEGEIEVEVGRERIRGEMVLHPLEREWRSVVLHREGRA